MAQHRPKPVDGRAEPRLKVFRLGCVHAGDTQFRAHLLDVSPRGARLHAGQTPEQGIRITLACSTVNATGTVRWVEATRFGIRFDTPLVTSDLDAILASAPNQ